MKVPLAIVGPQLITRRSVLLGLGASLVAGVACSSGPDDALTAQGLEDERRSANCPALAAAAVRKGHAVKKWVTGERLVASGVAVTAQDVWHLGSITKSMTATLVARLVEQGRVRWDDTAGELLKNVAPDMHQAYKSASFRHLLSHRAGLAKDIPMNRFLKYPAEATNVREERSSYAREALRMTPVGAKEATFLYSNNGYVVAGAMLEAKLEASWEDLIRTHVFGPLRLTSAGFGPPGEKERLTQPAGHALRGGRIVARRPGQERADNPQVLGPAGRVHMNLDDVLVYLNTHRDGSAFLKPDSWRTLHSAPFSGDYAMGWEMHPNGARGHSGSNGLWYARVLFDRDRGISAMAAANEGWARVGEPVDRILRRAVAAVA